jgi:hypothetical protein
VAECEIVAADTERGVGSNTVASHRKSQPSNESLEYFASRVVRAAEKVAGGAARNKGTYGGYKVFVHAAWAVGKFDESLPAFKRRLVEANRHGLIRLGRADLAGAMNPYDVRRSEISDGGSTFNFIILDPKTYA